MANTMIKAITMALYMGVWNSMFFISVDQKFLALVEWYGLVDECC